MKKTIQIIYITILLVLMGCKTDSNNDSDIKGQDTPEQWINKYFTALENNNEQQYLECFLEKDKVEAEMEYNYLIASKSLTNALEKKYGKYLMNQNIYYPNFDLELRFIGSYELYNITDMINTINIKGSKATFFISNQEESPYGLCKVHNVWFYDADIIPFFYETPNWIDAASLTTNIVRNEKIELQYIKILFNMKYYELQGKLDIFRDEMDKAFSDEAIDILEKMFAKYSNVELKEKSNESDKTDEQEKI